MAVFRFSALSDGQAISFDPAVDVLNFDQATIAAADLRVSDEGGSTRITVVNGPLAGKDVVLLNTVPERISITNVTFADGSALLVGDARSAVDADNGANNLAGTAGRDNLAGLGGNDTMLGGGGDDVFVMSSGTAASYGTDSIDGGAGFDILEFAGVARSGVRANISATGTLSGGGTSGAGSATLVSIEGVIGGDFNDLLIGGGAANLLVGGAGNDTLDGSSGNDTLRGGAGADSIRGGSGSDQFVFAETPGTANADRLTDVLSGTDKLVFDRSAFTALGASGNFAAGDGRFFAAAGATSGHDADDRLIYNPTTGQLFYDADGNGAGTAQLVATLNGAPAVAATDILVVGQAPASSTIRGTTGDDSMTGTAGDDSMEGLAGNDTLVGQPGDDTLVGGPGNDTYVVDGAGDVIIENAGEGIDRAVVDMQDRTLDANVENLTLVNGFSGRGNALDNVIDGDFFRIDGADGDDTLIGNERDQFFQFVAGSGNYGNDSVSGGEGDDTMFFGNNVSAVNVDMRTGIATGGGGGGSGSVTFTGIEQVVGTAFNDFLTADDLPSDTFFAAILFGAGGNDTLIGGAGNDFLSPDGAGFSGLSAAGNGNDEVHAGAGDDYIRLGDFQRFGNYGSDTIDGGDGTDEIDIPGFSNVFVDLSTGQLSGGGDSGGSAALLNIEDVTVSLGFGSDDVIIGNASANRLASGAGSDTVRGGAGNDMIDTFSSSTSATGADHLSGEDGNDLILAFDPGNGNRLSGGRGNDRIESGNPGMDIFFFGEAPGSANADVIVGFGSSADFIELDNVAHANLGATGAFAPDDARFAAGAGFTSGRDASDRVIYDTSTGRLFYDADGNGPGAAQLIATLQGIPAVAAANIVVSGSAAGGVIQGTAGNDSLTGTGGNDSISGLGGNDTITGLEGNDTMRGGDGNDVFRMSSGSAEHYGADAIDGGAGFDIVDFTGVARSGVGANISAAPGAAVTGGGNNLGGSATVTSIEGIIGGDFNDQLIGGGAANLLQGGAGNDTLDGSSGNDTLRGGTGNDSMRGGAGNDQFVFAEAPGTTNADRITDMLTGTDKLAFDDAAFTAIGAAGNFAAGDGRFAAGAGFTSGRDASDRLIYNTTTGQLFYDADGSGAGAAQLVATLNGAPALAATDITVI